MSLKHTLAAALAALALIGPAVAADEERSAIPVADYTVFVDPPTGFVFVKLPAGWKFAGKVSEQEVARLPQSVVTALLQRDAEPMLARRDGVGAAPAR